MFKTWGSLGWGGNNQQEWNMQQEWTIYTDFDLLFNNIKGGREHDEVLSIQGL